MDMLAISLLWMVSPSGRCSTVAAVAFGDIRYEEFKRASGSPPTWVPGSRLLQCAVQCVHDDRCVAIGVDRDCTGFREMPQTSTSVWMRVSGAESAESLPPEHCRMSPTTLQDIGQRTKAFFLLASNRSRTLTLLDCDTGKIRTWTPDIPPSGSTFRGDIAGIETDVSKGEVFVYFNNKIAIYRGRFFQTHVERIVTHVVGTIGGLVVFHDSAFFSNGRKIKKVDLTDPKYGTKILGEANVNVVSVYQDYINGKCIIFWPERRASRIQRALCTEPLRKMRSLMGTSVRGPWGLLSMTIDVHDHVIFTLSALGDICRLDDIASRLPRSRLRRVVRLPYRAVPGQILMYHGSRVYIFTPNKKNIDAMDMKLRVFIRDMVSGDCLAAPPTAITIVK